MRTLGRLLVNAAVTVVVLAVFARALPGLQLTNITAAVLAVVVISLLNAYVRPLLVRVTLPLTVATLGFFSLLLNGLLIQAASLFVPGFYVSDILTAVVVSFGLALSHMFVSNSLLYRDDRYQVEYQVIRRMARERGVRAHETTPGLILLEIDGLSEPVLRKALEGGYMPTLARWLETGRYKLVGWECGLPSQTSSMQAGILHGSHRNIPAFRFYDKRQRRLLVSNYPNDADDIIRPLLNGQGLLRDHGFSLNNWASGDAPEATLTVTTFADAGYRVFTQAQALYAYFANTFLFQEALVGMVVDMAAEWREGWRQRLRKVWPRVDRHFPYPLVRATTTALLPQLCGYVLISKMFQGIASAYTTFVAYDEVAHHSGVDRPDALRVLTQLDHQIQWITQAAEHTPRPYEFVVLSDHGQSQGATFRQRYGVTLAELVNSLVSEEYATATTDYYDEGLDAINLLLSHLASDNSRKGRLLRRALLRRIVNGQVRLGRRPNGAATGVAHTVVCASGNMGLIYFPDWPDHLSLEDIYVQFPGLVDGLVDHPGIAYVLARSEADGPLVINKNGIYYLDTDVVEGDNPLAPFGPHAAAHLRELSAYENLGDLVVNSFYNPETGEVAAFEELVGSHGGLGGPQTQPFLMYPTRLEPDAVGELVGAPAVYHLIRRWQARLMGLEGVTVLYPSPAKSD